MSMDLFAAFGLEIPKELEEKKETKVKETKKKETKKKSSSSKATKDFKLPFTVYSNYFEPIVFEKIDGEDVVKETVVREKIAEKYFDASAFSFSYKEIEDTRYVILSPSKLLPYVEGNIVSGSAKLVFAGQVISLSDFMSATDSQVIVDDLIQYVLDYVSMSDYDKSKFKLQVVKKDVIDLLFVAAEDEALEETTDELSLYIATRGEVVPFVYSNSNASDKSEDKSDDESDSEDGEDGEDAPKSFLDCLKDSIMEKYPEYRNRINVTISNSNTVFVSLSNYEKASAPVKKETTYKIEGKVLSMLFKRWDLDETTFDGKKSVTLADICNFLQNEGYPEFSPDRTRVTENGNYLMVSVIGSTKGAIEHFSSQEDVMAFFNSRQLCCRRI